MDQQPTAEVYHCISLIAGLSRFMPVHYTGIGLGVSFLSAWFICDGTDLKRRKRAGLMKSGEVDGGNEEGGG